jgi:hypothetical protein
MALGSKQLSDNDTEKCVKLEMNPQVLVINSYNHISALVFIYFSFNDKIL